MANKILYIVFAACKWSKMNHSNEVKSICAKAYLDHIKSLKMRIDDLEEEIEPLKDIRTNTMDLREHVSCTPNPKKLEDAVIRLQELIEQYVTEQVAYVDELSTAHMVLHRLSRPEWTRALTKHYLHDYTWDRVCVDMNYSWQGMMSIRKRALYEVYDLMPEQWRREPIPNAII